ncbi:hypothetical protein QNI16_23465 [Cytophagaceae bacterium YF14B1]|uniref:Adenylosuccinate lyase n=1 Tax=Xanthocytophaga flava TaxID=3048013 RepID=A0AAE3QU89_9BACT|nr:hypothetical protein [Xanthocytophaga flavus]MDJ1483478.1 hypothetical protein [Xanthocytophaga flavus]
MNLKEQLLKEHSKENTLAIAKYISYDSQRFSELIELFLSGEYRLSQRAAWPVSYCVEEYPNLIQPYLSQIITIAQQKDIHPAVTRNVLRLLQNITIPEELEGEIIDFCFVILKDRSQPSAIRAFAITVAANICQQYEELQQELCLLIEDHLPYEKPAFKSRATKLLRMVKGQ